ncbi:MAG: AbrB/MazE/SpoVT family DNA-binding domain-containing protein [Candidatus Nanohalobium sp.]
MDPQYCRVGVQYTLSTQTFIPILSSISALLIVLVMVTWKRKIRMPEEQVRITLPKRWLDEHDLGDKDEIEVETMKRESALKITIPENED